MMFAFSYSKRQEWQIKRFSYPYSNVRFNFTAAQAFIKSNLTMNALCIMDL
jgi:hypothetical protein